MLVYHLISILPFQFSWRTPTVLSMVICPAIKLHFPASLLDWGTEWTISKDLWKVILGKLFKGNWLSWEASPFACRYPVVQHHLLKGLSLFHCICFAPLSIICWLYLCGSIFAPLCSVLLIYLFFCEYYIVLMNVAL